MQKLQEKLKNTPRNTSLVPCSVSSGLNKEETLSDQNKVLTCNNSEENQQQHRAGSDLRVLNVVYVLNKRNQSLMPTCPSRARRLLKNNKASEKCRKKIAEQLDLKFSDKGLNVVMPIGRGRKGSSFDSLKCNGKAQSMKVLDRWKEYKNNSVEFTNVLKMNESLRDMGTKIFGPFPKGL